MALRDIRGAGLRRVARRSALALTVLYGAGAVLATGPAITHFRSAFIADASAGYGEAAPGDHLQTVYRFWLVGHQLERGAAPWRDPYTFQPLAEPQLNLGGWPLGPPFWPLDALFGPVVAWNLLLLASVVCAGLAAAAWLRRLGLSPPAAALGGLAFAIAPYRLAQSGGHLLGWIAILLPVCLWAFERSRTGDSRRGVHGFGLLSAAALASIPLSSQVHLALGAIPFCAAYAAIRFRRAPAAWLGAGALAGIGVGVAIRETVIAGSIASGGRSLDQVSFYSADWLDLVSRFRLDGLEQFVYVGLLTPLAAVAGLAVLARGRPWLAALLGLGALLPLLLALGTNLPLYTALWHALPPLRFARVPGRLVPIADLALAALAAFAVARALALIVSPGWRRLAAGAALVLVVADLLALPLGSAAADPANAAYRRLEGAAPGRILELPLFGPGTALGSVYHYYDMQAPRERPSGYSTLAPPPALSFAVRFERLGCGVWLPGDAAALEALGVRYLVFHRGLFGRPPAGSSWAWFAWRGLVENGYRPLAHDGEVWLLARRSPEGGREPNLPPVAEPDRAVPVFCTGWRGWTMTETRAAFWLWGEGRHKLELEAPAATAALLRVDGRPARRLRIASRATVVVELRGRRWHLVALEVPRLLGGAAPQGLRLMRLTLPAPRAG